MALQDLTPQLRTRMGRLERIVGIFVILATLLLFTGFVYYLYHTAERKGWFLIKAPYFTFVRSAAGLKVGDPVKLMGFDVGEITEIEAMPPSDIFNVYIEFVIRSPYYGYLWSDSKARVTAGDFLGHRYIEVTKGVTGAATYTNALSVANKDPLSINRVWDEKSSNYVVMKRPYWLDSDEAPAVTERLEQLVLQVEKALPAILSLTNQVTEVMTNSGQLLAHIDEVVRSTRPLVTNITLISDNLKNPKGSLGEWVIPTNLNQQLDKSMTAAQSTIDAARSNLNVLTASINAALINLADITSNLNAQVQANSLILTDISTLIGNTDEFVQGLKRNWLLKGSFKQSPVKPGDSILDPGSGPP